MLTDEQIAEIKKRWAYVETYPANVEHLVALIADAQSDIPALVAEVRELRAIINADAEVTSLAMDKGQTDIQLRHPVVPFIANALYDIISDSQAQNYVEIALTAGPDGKRENLTLCLQRVNGKTPHELRTEAEAQRDKALAEVRELKDKLAGYVEGYDPAERLPDNGQRVWLEFKDTETMRAALGTWHAEWKCFSLPRSHAPDWIMAVSAIRRWHPLPGDER